MPNFVDQVKRGSPVNGLSTYTMETGAQDVITLVGSILGGALHGPSDKQKAATITASMLDKGTTNKNKHEISDQLESVGAQIQFISGHHHTQFTAHCLKGDLRTVISLLAEQLREPSFPEDELSTLKTRVAGNLTRTKEETKKLASIGLLQTLYPEEHPNYRQSIDQSIEGVEILSKKDISTFHNSFYGLGNINIVVAGDINIKNLKDFLIEGFDGWESREIKPLPLNHKAKERSTENKKIHVPDKTSADLYIGQAIGIDRDHKDYCALMMAVYILGGNFSARLMQTVRDKQGLTYGIGSSISGVGYGADGYWSTWGTFAPDVISKGLQATTEQITQWYNYGITTEELSAKKSTITGAYKVGMDTTGGIAAQILTNANRGRNLKYLDAYPDMINALSVDQVNMAIKTYINPDQLVTVSAGTLD